MWLLSLALKGAREGEGEGGREEGNGQKVTFHLLGIGVQWAKEEEHAESKQYW